MLCLGRVCPTVATHGNLRVLQWAFREKGYPLQTDELAYPLHTRRSGNISCGAQAAKKARQGVRYAALEDLDVMDPETMQPVPRNGEVILQPLDPNLDLEIVRRKEVRIFPVAELKRRLSDN